LLRAMLLFVTSLTHVGLARHAACVCVRVRVRVRVRECA